MYGNNNLPDSSNMCHESTSVGLPLSIGVPVGTVTLPDFDKTDCIIFIGHNTGVNAPRMLHPLQECAKRGVPIIIFNPLRERGFERFTNPQNPIEMLSGSSTPISSQYHQINVGGDKAALMGVCKALFELDDAERKAGRRERDRSRFSSPNTLTDSTEFEACVRGHDWAELEIGSGLNRAAMEAAATVYARAKAAIIGYGMGMTQHVNGVENVQMVTNLLLMRGNIGKPGAGVLPIRGHSNVQGQRTVGITEKPELVPNDKLKELYGFEPPKEKGLNCTEAAEAIIKGDVRAMVQLGGNLVRALPDHRPAAAGLAQASADGADRDQAQQILPGAWRGLLHPAVPRPHRDRPAERRAAGGQRGGQHRLHPRLARLCRTGQRRASLGTVDHRRARQGGAAAKSESRLGRLGRRLQPHPRRDRAHLSRDVQGLQQAHVAAGRLPSAARRPATASGRPRPARPTSSRRKRSRRTSRSIRSAATSSSSRPSAARASSTPRSIQTATASAACTARAWCCS